MAQVTPFYVIEVIRAENVPKLDVASESDPFVRFWVEDSSKKIKSPKFTSLTKDDNPNPIWNCVRNLGIVPSAGDSLVIHLYDEDASTDEQIGKFSIPLVDLTYSPKTFKAAGKKWSIDIQLLQSPKTTRRTVFLIRHGESKWNEAQASKNVTGLLNYDHPLSEIGIGQCISFNRQWRTALNDKKTPRLEEWMAADCIFSSPLTRAAQTAFITTDEHPHLKNKKNPIVLWSSAREIKNAGGLDTVGNHLGEDIERRVRQHCQESEAAHAGLQTSFAVGDTGSQWWTQVNDFESKKQVQARLNDFMFRICFYPHDNATIVIGHSLFFQQFCTKYMSDEFKSKNPEKALKITSTLMANASCLCVQIDFSGPEPTIVAYNDLFD